MKQNKGITLIALVVTIIVLLILAGVAIAMLTGDNSILKRAQSTKAYNALGAAKDEVSMAYNAAYTEYMRIQYDDAASTDDKAKTVRDLFATQVSKITDWHGCDTGTGLNTVDTSTGKIKIQCTIDGKAYYVEGTQELGTGTNPSQTSSTFKWGPITDPTNS